MLPINFRKLSALGISSVSSLGLMFFQPANAAVVTFDRISGAAEMVTVDAMLATPRLNDLGTVAYVSTPAGPPTIVPIVSVVVSDGSTRRVIAVTDPNDRRLRRISGSVGINDQNDVVFVARGDSMGAASTLFVTSGMDLVERATIPLSRDGVLLASPSINNMGDVAYREVRIGASSEIRLIINSGGESRILTDISGRTLEGLGQPFSNNAGQVVAFGVFDDGSEGVFLTDGTTSQIIALNGGDIESASGASINDRGDVSYVVRYLDGLQEVRLFSGTTSSVIFDTSGAFQTLSFTDLNENRDIIASGTLDDGRQAIGAFFGGALNILLAAGDTLDGLVVAEIFFGRESFNDTRQFAFSVRFDDGTSGVFRGSIDDLAAIPIPGGAYLFLTSAVAWGGYSRRRRSIRASVG